ncbi:MAG: hypothetical protein JWO59_1462 [Chloroflexi bacterium]|nr:hypothetical protein [Chloroflexota bacterium]
MWCDGATRRTRVLPEMPAKPAPRVVSPPYEWLSVAGTADRYQRRGYIRVPSKVSRQRAAARAAALLMWVVPRVIGPSLLGRVFLCLQQLYGAHRSAVVGIFEPKGSPSF